MFPRQFSKITSVMGKSSMFSVKDRPKLLNGFS